jgi:ribosomal protein S18 acetylase RimI-like enzyme
VTDGPSIAARPAVAADAARIIELDAEARAAVVAQRGGALYLLREAVAFDGAVLDRADAYTVVGTIDEIAFGYAIVVEDPVVDGAPLAMLQQLYVDPGARDVGVGEAMMDLVLAWCEERGFRGIDALALPGDRATKNFFERYGLTARAILVHRALGARSTEW